MSCTHQNPEPVPELEKPSAPPVSTYLVLHQTGDIGDVGIVCADIFVYSTEGTLPLTKHVRIDSPATNEDEKIELCLETDPGRWRAVVVVNSPSRFNTAALSRYESIRLMEVNFEDDDTEHPIMNGEMDFTAGERVYVKVKPMLSRVILRSVTNTLDDYTLMEEPRIWLSNIPQNAKLFQEKDFRPGQTIENGAQIALPHDVGFYTATFGSVLWCYPNDTDENILGTTRTTLKLACIIDGKAETFDINLPPIPRASTIQIDWVLPEQHD